MDTWLCLGLIHVVSPSPLAQSNLATHSPLRGTAECRRNQCKIDISSQVLTRIKAAVPDMIAPWESKVRNVALHFAPSTRHQKPVRDYLGLYILMSVVLPKSHLSVINPYDTYPAPPTCRGSERRWTKGVGSREAL
ncbi:hypothetical protein EV401DRAFT_592942 [Pisolithus croceorrhizus]|nr:hypothetical protein EV401DRAFT_592942 [Pisolithus croceorrhizus]